MDQLPKNQTLLHIRLPLEVEKLLKDVATENHMKKSTLGRIIIQRHLNDYSRNRFFAW